MKINNQKSFDLNSAWNNMCAGLFPAADNLKFKLQSYWIRFHCLPESKRYPDNSDEMNEIKKRHNILLKELCGKNSDIFILTSPSEFDFEIINDLPISKIDAKSTLWKSIKVEGDDEMEFDVYYSICNYKHGNIDYILEKVANDEIWNVMIIGKNGDWIYHPYDGGCDIITKNNEKTKMLAKKYSDWLPKNEYGL